MRKIFLIVLLTFPAMAIASDNFGPGPCGNPEIYEESNAFVTVPSQIGGCAVGIPSAVVGSAVGGAIGTLLLPMGANPIDGVAFGLLFFGNGGNYLGGAIVGLPFWATEQLFYELPKKAFTRSKSRSPAKESSTSSPTEQ